MNLTARERLIFALDFPDTAQARATAEQVADRVGVLKVGLELFVREGPPAVELGAQLGCEVFLDLKLHDIPATVGRAVRSACQLGVRYLTVHAAGGQRMIEAAAEAAVHEGTGLKLLAVTVLTSLDAQDLAAIGVAASDPTAQVARLAQLAVAAGAPGLVCSSSEVASLREVLGPAPLLITPGIRMAGGALDDQKRVGTPRSAIASGASLLVVGRPIRDADDPHAAATAICDEIAQASQSHS